MVFNFTATLRLTLNSTADEYDYELWYSSGESIQVQLQVTTPVVCAHRAAHTRNASYLWLDPRGLMSNTEKRARVSQPPTRSPRPNTS